MITTPGIINVDFADIRAILSNAGSALMGIGTGVGDNRAVDAAKMAINSPLLDVSIDGAKGVLFAIAGSSDMTMYEIQEAAKVIVESADPNAKIIFGAIQDSKLDKNEIKITVIASGFPENAKKKAAPMGGLMEGRPAAQETKEAPTLKEQQAEMQDIKTNKPPAWGNKRTEEVKGSKVDEDDDWSSIPAFLRRNRK